MNRRECLATAAGAAVLAEAGCLVVGLFTSVAVSAADAPALAVEIPPNDTNIRLVGRFDLRDAAGPRCAWSGSSIIAKFEGTALNVKLRGNNDQFQVVIDGKPTSVISLKGDQTVYPVAQGLADGSHTVELFKRTEALFGTVQFLGLQLEKGKKLQALPARPTRRIELIGDSITCGYGNEAPKKEDRFSANTENNYLTYGAITGRELGAEYTCIAWSGRKLWPDNTIPEIYGRALPQDAKSAWDFTSWKPDVVVLNLGTNDFGSKNPERKGWTDACQAFIRTIRKNYPEAHIFCAVGPMMSDGYPPGNKALSTIRGYLTGVVDEANKAGDKRVHFLEFATQDQANGIGADWHPSVKTHQIMAEKLVAAVTKELGW
jgi:lysophospholipase L1-like esterase